MLLCALCCAACSPTPAWEQEEPQAALKGFLVSLKHRQTQSAWEFLNASDRATLETRAKAIAERSGGVVSPEPHALLRPGHIIASSDEIASIKPESEDSGDHVTMLVTLHDTVRPEEHRVIQIAMERVDGRWTVDLPLESGSHP